MNERGRGNQGIAQRHPALLAKRYSTIKDGLFRGWDFVLPLNMIFRENGFVCRQHGIRFVL